MNMSDEAAHLPDLAVRARWQRWEMESLDTLRGDGRRGLKKTGLTNRPTPADERAALALAKATEEASTRGHREGTERGLREGQAQGFAQGHAQGLEQGRQEGFSAGRQEGRAQGLAQGAEEARAQAARLDSLADTCATALAHLEEEVGQSLIQLATHIAEHILRTRLNQDPALIVALVQDTLQDDAAPDTTLTLHLHPDDLALVQEFLQQQPDLHQHRLLADEHISRGGCVIDTPHGCIDATLETRWRRVVSALGKATETA